MTSLLVALVAGLGVHLLYTGIVAGWTGLGLGPNARRRVRPARRRDWLVQAGLAEVRWRDVGAITVGAFVLSSAATMAILGAWAPALAVGACTATAPLAAHRQRRIVRRSAAQEAWPRLLEELRLLTGSLGRSVPQAIFEVGARAPMSMRDAFDEAHREWLLSTDFSRTTQVLKERLADPTADVVCETLLVAHTIGGADLDRRLDALIEDRIMDTQGRKDARAKQAGARFARRMVLIVPFGMALAGMSVGNGRAAYAGATGQALTTVAVGIVAACWLWAGRILRLPDEERVFA